MPTDTDTAKGQARAKLDDIIAWVEEADKWWAKLTLDQKALLIQGIERDDLRPFFPPVSVNP